MKQNTNDTNDQDVFDPVTWLDELGTQDPSPSQSQSAQPEGVVGPTTAASQLLAGTLVAQGQADVGDAMAHATQQLARTNWADASWEEWAHALGDYALSAIGFKPDSENSQEQDLLSYSTWDAILQSTGLTQAWEDMLMAIPFAEDLQDTVKSLDIDFGASDVITTATLAGLTALALDPVREFLADNIDVIISGIAEYAPMVAEVIGPFIAEHVQLTPELVGDIAAALLYKDIPAHEMGALTTTLGIITALVPELSRLYAPMHPSDSFAGQMEIIANSIPGLALDVLRQPVSTAMDALTALTGLFIPEDQHGLGFMAAIPRAYTNKDGVTWVMYPTKKGVVAIADQDVKGPEIRFFTTGKHTADKWLAQMANKYLGATDFIQVPQSIRRFELMKQLPQALDEYRAFDNRQLLSLLTGLASKLGSSTAPGSPSVDQSGETNPQTPSIPVVPSDPITGPIPLPAPVPPGAPAGSGKFSPQLEDLQALVAGDERRRRVSDYLEPKSTWRTL